MHARGMTMLPHLPFHARGEKRGREMKTKAMKKCGTTPVG